MNDKTEPKTKDKKLALIFLIILEGVCLSAAITCIIQKNYPYVAMCALIAVLLVIIMSIRNILKIRPSYKLKIIFMCFAVSGPILGGAFNIYHLIPVWDTLLHTLNGFLFAGVGCSLVYSLQDDPDFKPKLAVRLLVSFCVSMTVAVLWEFWEYTLDRLMVADMQVDTLIPNINSYLLGDTLGSVGSITDITSVVVNGQTLPGYIDIGLFDTMIDMLVNFVGALVFCAALIVDKKGRLNAVFIPEPISKGRT